MDEDTPHLSENEEEAFEEEEEGEGNEEGEGEYVQVITEDGRTLNISLHLFRLITAGFRRANLQEDDDTDEEDHSQPSTTLEERNTISLLGSELESLMKLESGLSVNVEPLNIAHLWHRHQEAGSRTLGEQHAAYRSRNRPLSVRNHRFISSSHVPNRANLVDRYANTVFCAEYSPTGEMFVTASQDRYIRIYDANTWNLSKRILTQEMGWAVLCTDFSPNTEWVAYSGWHHNVYLVNTSGEHEIHEGLEVMPSTSAHRHNALFSVKFSADSRELLGGSKDAHVYLYDIETKRRTARVLAHNDDINNVAWADDTSQVFFTGSDDRMIKVWDRRILRGENAQPAGLLPGHLHGITYIDSRNDGRYLISNGKDQRIKLWDLRKMAAGDSDTHPAPLRGMYDYRMGMPDNRMLYRRLDNDASIMTYRGHRVAETLIRCKFSPAASTGQRYIYTGSHGGTVHIYDVLSGQAESILNAHSETVRDLDWHPYLQRLVTTGWDGHVYEWNWSPDGTTSQVPLNQSIYNRRRRPPVHHTDSDSD